MTVTFALRDALDPVMAGQVWPDFAPADARLPYLVFKLLDNNPVTTVHRATPVLAFQRFGIIVMDRTRKGVEKLLPSIRAAIDQAIQDKKLDGRYAGESWVLDQLMDHEGCALDYDFIERDF